MKAMADAGLVDGSRIAILPELFWELAPQWRPQWTWLASSPTQDDWRDAEGRTTWVRAGDSVAVGYGAPAVSAGEGPQEFFVPGPVRRGARSRLAAVPKLAVALQLAGDSARGREILRDWPGQDHVWN